MRLRVARQTVRATVDGCCQTVWSTGSQRGQAASTPAGWLLRLLDVPWLRLMASRNSISSRIS